MSRFKSSTPISPGTSRTGGLRNKAAAARASKEKKFTPSKKDKPSGDSNQILKDLDEAQKRKDKPAENVGLGQGGRQTTDFLEDLKGAAQEGLFTGGNKTKAFMAKYGLDASDIVKLRTGINTGLGTFISSSDKDLIGKNILEAIAGDLIRQGKIRSSGPGGEFLQNIATDTFEKGMTKFDRPPMTGIFSMFPGAQLLTRGLDFITGGSPQGVRGLFYGRNVLGLTGEELDNFAASVANNPNLFNQMMSTPEMQKYQLDEFRSQINRDFMANRQGPDDDFVAEAAETPVVVPSPGIPSAPLVPFPPTIGLPTQPVLVQGAAPSVFSNFPQFNLSNYAQQGIANPNLINFNRALSGIA